MNLALEITLVVLACIGVTYSAPASISDAGPTEKPPITPVTSVVDNGKIQTMPPSMTKNSSFSIPPPHVDTANATGTTKVTVLNDTTEGSKIIAPVDIKNGTSENAKVDNSTDKITPQNSTTNSSAIIPATNSTEAPVTTITTQKTTITTKAAEGTTTTTTTTTAAAPTTTKATTPSPIIAHTTASEHAEPVPADGRQFDGPSFIGGIVLTVGLTAIGFIAFKFYKSGKIDRNYRTL